MEAKQKIKLQAGFWSAKLADKEGWG